MVHRMVHGIMHRMVDGGVDHCAAHPLEEGTRPAEHVKHDDRAQRVRQHVDATSPAGVGRHEGGVLGVELRRDRVDDALRVDGARVVEDVHHVVPHEAAQLGHSLGRARRDHRIDLRPVELRVPLD